MKTIKKLSLLTLALASAQVQTKQTQEDDNSMTTGRAITAPFAFATNLGVDAVTLDQTHQTRKYIDRNREGADQRDSSMSAGEGLLTPVAVPVSGVTGQGSKEVDRMRSSKNTSTTSTHKSWHERHEERVAERHAHEAKRRKADQQESNSRKQRDEQDDMDALL